MNTDNKIIIKGAREHNLKNIYIEIPRNKIICFVGVSGSGKSTIATDIIAAEGQRQYLESISTFASRLIKKSDKPDVDSIKGLSSTISIEQKVMRGSARSTVGTTTELYTYLRLLFSRVGSKKNLSAGHFSFNNPKGACSNCKGTGADFEVDLDILVDFAKTINEGAIKNSSFRVGGRYLNILKTTGRVDFDKPIKNLTKEETDFLLYSPHIKLKNAEQGFVQSYSWMGVVERIKNRAKDTRGGWVGEEKPYRKVIECKVCRGSRLKEKVLESKINNQNIGYYANLPITKLINEMKSFKGEIAKEVVQQMKELLQFMIDVGVGYLYLNRGVGTLSAGEAQRVKIARELGSDLIETIYVLDEPTVGLHARDTKNIIKILKKIRDNKNTVIVVEHDEQVMKEADQLVEIGPGAGRLGGNIVVQGSLKDVMEESNSLTGQYLSGKKRTDFSKDSYRKATGYLPVKDANLHNLKKVNVDIPTGIFTVITGVSGSGKSTLINDIFVKKYSEKVVFVDQSPVGASPRANSATYTGTFDYIRDLLASSNKVSKAIFSSNSTGGCPDCKGLGYNKIEMHFMSDIKIDCETCNGKKYKEETLKYKYQNKNIHEILEMTVEEALRFFESDEINKRLQMLLDVGLGYLALGQTLNTLSGGESQRLKLASKLHKNGEFYVLDEPTTGLHFDDIGKLLKLLHGLVDKGNSVLVIEHNMDIIKSADWVIDLGPEGGEKGGEVIFEGTPKDIKNYKKSFTGQYLNNQ